MGNNSEKPDVYAKIAQRRKRFEYFGTVHSVILVGTIYSWILHSGSTTTKGISLIAFVFIIIGNAFVWSIYGLGTKETSYKPKANKKLIFFYSTLLIGLIELFYWIELNYAGAN